MERGIQRITELIREDAQNYHNVHLLQVKNDTDKRFEKENKRLQKDFEKRCSLLKKHNAYEYEQEHDIIEKHINRELLEFKVELIHEIADEAIKKLRNIPKNEFLLFFADSLKGLNGHFDLYIGEFSGDKLKQGDIDSIIINGNVSITLHNELISQKSGFVLKNNSVEYNCLFEDLIEDNKKHRLSEIMKEIFE